jgi:hypothetical protein
VRLNLQKLSRENSNNKYKEKATAECCGFFFAPLLTGWSVIKFNSLRAFDYYGVGMLQCRLALLIFLILNTAVFSGSLLAKVQFLDEKKNEFSPELGIVLFLPENNIQPEPSVEQWTYNSGRFSPYLLPIHPGSKVNMQLKGLRIPTIKVFNDNFLTQVGYRHRNASVVFDNPGVYQLDSSLTFNECGRVLVFPYARVGVVREDGLLIEEQLEPANWKLLFFHENLEGFSERLVEVLNEETTKVVFSIQGNRN